MVGITARPNSPYALWSITQQNTQHQQVHSDSARLCCVYHRYINTGVDAGANRIPSVPEGVCLWEHEAAAVGPARQECLLFLPRSATWAGGVEAGGVEGVGGGFGGGWCVSAVALTAVVGVALVSVRVHSEERLI